MIIDCHAHVFTHWIGACGHPTRDVHNRYLQRMITRTAASTFRARDWARADTKALYRADDAGWSGLTDVDFRVGRFGQLEFTHEGEDHVIQYMPVGMQEMAAPPELMLAQMMYAGVDHCLLQAGGSYGAMTEMNAFAQRQYPGRMTGMMHVDEAMAGSGSELAKVDHAFDVLKLRGLYFNVEFAEPPRLSLAARRAGDGAVLGEARAAGHRALPRAELGPDLRQGGLHGPHRGARPDPGAPSAICACTWR